MEPNEQPIHDQHAVRKLYRSGTKRQVGGVCGGIAEYTSTDPTVIRVLFIVLAAMGPGTLLYPLLWIFVPEAPRPVLDRQQPQPMPGDSVQAT